jgi:hypothetical protein
MKENAALLTDFPWLLYEITLQWRHAVYYRKHSEIISTEDTRGGHRYVS